MKGKNAKVEAMSRESDMAQMISPNLVAELGLPPKAFSSRLRHSQQVAELSTAVCMVLDLDISEVYEMGLWHDIGHRILGHQSEEFLAKMVPLTKSNRAVRHEMNSEYSFFLAGLHPSLSIIEAARLHSGERKVYMLEPGIPVSNAIISQELSINNDKEIVYDVAPSSIQACVVRICDPLTHMRDDYKTLVKLGEIDGGLYVPTNEDIVKGFCENSDLTVPGKEIISVGKDLFGYTIRLRKQVEAWQNSPKVLKLRALEQKLLGKFWEHNLNLGLTPEEIIDKMNVITESDFFEELERENLYTRK